MTKLAHFSILSQTPQLSQAYHAPCHGYHRRPVSYSFGINPEPPFHWPAPLLLSGTLILGPLILHPFLFPAEVFFLGFPLYLTTLTLIYVPFYCVQILVNCIWNFLYESLSWPWYGYQIVLTNWWTFVSIT